MSMEKKSFIVSKNEKLVKSCLSNIGGLSYTVFMNTLKNKDVKINGKRVNKDVAVFEGDNVEVFLSNNKKESFNIIFEDDNIIVINKKSGYTAENIFEDLSNQIKEVYFIHRLDRNTKGLMIFAKNKNSEKELLEGFKKHAFIKEYKAEVFGKLEKKEDVLTAYLVKDNEIGKVSIFDKEVKNSVLIKTGYKVIEERENTSVLLVRLYTGKTHQIRAHLSHVGHFIVGDGKYGNDEFNKKYAFKEQQLLSYSLTLKFEKENKLFYLNNKKFCIE